MKLRGADYVWIAIGLGVGAMLDAKEAASYRERSGMARAPRKMTNTLLFGGTAMAASMMEASRR